MKNNSNKILNGDATELFKEIPDNSIDITFADPPFNLKKKYNGYKDSLEFEEYLEWCELWIKEMVRVTKPTGSIFIHNIPKWLTYYSSILNKYATFRHWISWDAPSSPMGKSLQPSHYGILYYVKDIKHTKFYELRYPHKRCRKCGYLLKDYGGKKQGLHPFGPLLSDVWTDIHRIKHNKYRDEHPCQLPIHLLERIILMSTDNSDIVLDPFMGTGTTAIASKRLGRNYIGFELDNKYVSIANDKLKYEQSNSKLGEFWVSFFLKDIISLRNVDWECLSEYYLLPQNNRAIDHTKIEFIDKKKIIKHFDLVINGNGKIKQDSMQQEFCNCP
ncbi:MAG: restriction endonuclease [Ignavibacteria bacterium CG2_30_36_16]|nr:site-specific DNA-methyltransferase [Ignavibacteria bacterium]OIP59432.1 MAG: restriction endonuclease [Ignavibacteria bacterium CG2_30_36_16]PJB01823.1 MAG: restriction endonuclease [Ignavibacteria bacterium CG_4_9_14_3_um_filter_36_18]